MLWRQPTNTRSGNPLKFFIYSSAEAALRIVPEGIDGATTIVELQPMSKSDARVEAALRRLPHLRGCTAFGISMGVTQDMLDQLVISQLAVTAMLGEEVHKATGVQKPGLMDERCAFGHSQGFSACASACSWQLVPPLPHHTLMSASYLVRSSLSRFAGSGGMDH